MSEARVHIASAPGRTLDRPSRIVQPCGRCGIVLSEFDEENPPMSPIIPGQDNTHAWWDGQVLRDPGYPDGTTTYFTSVGDDEGLVTPLCDPAEADAAGVEVFRTEVSA